MQKLVKYKDEEYVLNEDALQYECQHINAYLEGECCNGEDCLCGGMQVVICDNESCTGISESQEIDLWENLKRAEMEDN